MASIELSTNEQKPSVRKPGDRFFRVPRVTQVHIPILPVKKPKIRKFSPMLIIYGFAVVIALGTLLLVLPISSKSGDYNSFAHALFTSTSSVCVTGLVVVDTADHWSYFGQAVILVLIQVGGFGFMTSATLFLLLMVRRIGLRERLLIGESMGLTRLGGLGSLVMKIAIFSIIVEAVGTIFFYIRFSIDYPAGTALWKSVFQSVSAFNNAGFDIFGNFKSMSGYSSDTMVMLVTASLIILGGISFLVFADIFKVRNLSRMTLDSKLVIFTTLILLTLGTLVILSTEFDHNSTLGAMSLPQKLLNAFFHSVSPRTAGFSSIDMSQVTDYTLFFTMILMFIGGAAGSTAGGIKVNTFGMLIAIIWSTIRGKEYAGAYGREFKTQQVNRVLTIVMLSLGLIALIVFVLTITEDFKFLDLLFETVSAFGTVGLSRGITPDLSTAGMLLITVMMFVGRLGSLTLALSLLQRQKQSGCRYPQESIRIG